MAMAAMAAGLVSCNSKSGQYKVSLDPFGETPVAWAQGETLATWDNTLTSTELSVAEVTEEGTAIIQMPEEMKTDGVRRFIHPVAAYAGEGMVSIPTVQSGQVNYLEMPVYAEAVDNSDVLSFKALCGVVRLHLTTPEKIASITVSTGDSLGYMSGLFVVENYPDVKLGVDGVVGTVNSVRCEQLPDMDFTQGADVDFLVAPGCFKTFTVTMTTPDGRVCVKNTKDDMDIVVDCNTVSTINIGSAENVMVFE